MSQKKEDSTAIPLFCLDPEGEGGEREEHCVTRQKEEVLSLYSVKEERKRRRKSSLGKGKKQPHF